MAQFWVASVPLTPRVTVYCHPIRSSDQIEMIMYSVTLICKSYACFSDFAVMVLVKNSIPGRLLFKHQHLNASPYGFAGVYRQCRCVITVCTRKSPACHKVCNFNKIYCPFFRCNINKDNVHKSIISWSRSVHEKRCIGVSIKLNIYRKCWKISNINEDLTILLSIKILPLTPILRSAFSTNCNSICRKWKSDHCIKVTGTQFHSNDCNSIGTAKIIRKIGTTCHCRKNHFFRRIVQIIYTASWQVTILLKAKDAPECMI